MDERLKQLFREHKQLGDWSCSASAHEFVAKLHGKISDSDNPLQKDTKASHKAGFQFGSFFTEKGFTSHDEHLAPRDAVKKFEAEAAKDRHPLVSLVRKDKTAHIVVVVPGDSGGVALADPGKKDLITHTSEETIALLESASKAVPNRPDIHCLFYAQADPPPR